MANNEVKFSLKIEDNATGTIKDVSASTKDLSRVVKNVTQEVNKAQPGGVMQSSVVFFRRNFATNPS